MSTDPHASQDPNGKDDVTGYQPDFLREVGEAVAAGFEPQDDDPADREPIPEGDHDDLWAGRVGL